jgi:hypothetical protein
VENGVREVEAEGAEAPECPVERVRDIDDRPRQVVQQHPSHVRQVDQRGVQQDGNPVVEDEGVIEKWLIEERWKHARENAEGNPGADPYHVLQAKA